MIGPQFRLARALLFAFVVVFSPDVRAEEPSGDPLPGTRRLELEGDLAARMVDGIDRFLLAETEKSLAARANRWKRDLSSSAAYARSVEVNRARLRRIVGATNRRDGFGQPSGFRYESPGAADSEQRAIRIEWVRWPVHYVGGGWSTEGEGLLLTPVGMPHRADVVALPDADTTPASFVPTSAPGPGAGIPIRLAQSGCRVLVPFLVNRDDEHSLVAGERRTNQPHREFLYRQAFELGTHVIGYEIEKIESAIDCLLTEQGRGGESLPIGVIGYGEGGLLALYAAALDQRIGAACVSGYFDSRQDLWQEPIYRNVWSLLTEFGDAEVASLIAPRTLIVEASAFPVVNGPPQPIDGKQGAAPGRLVTPSLARAQKEFHRAKQFVEQLDPRPVLELIASGAGNGPPGDEATLRRFLQVLAPGAELSPRNAWNLTAADGTEHERHFRQFQQLVDFTQNLLAESERKRDEFWAKASRESAESWPGAIKNYREYFATEVIGRFQQPRQPLRPRSRLVYDEPTYRGYEVLLDVFPDVFAYGILLIPKNAGDRRLPVVVCQHGLEGRPTDVADPKNDHPAYHRYACRLAELGFVTFVPQNPYIGRDRFRTLQRKANPLQKSLFSVIVPQHEAIVEWLAAQPFVDPERIGFYGLSYGGKTAMRVPALVEGYCLSICSADFNEWIWKNASTRSRYSYLGSDEYEMVEFDLGNTFNYAEMAALICPRPFMVERGHHDGVAPDHWVAYEYAKVRKLYSDLKLPERTEIEFFDGPHTIHGVGTFEFLKRHLKLEF